MFNIFVFGYVGARAIFSGKDGDVEDEDIELSGIGDEELNFEELKKDKDLKNYWGLLEIYYFFNFIIVDYYR